MTVVGTGVSVLRFPERREKISRNSSSLAATCRISRSSALPIRVKFLDCTFVQPPPERDQLIGAKISRSSIARDVRAGRFIKCSVTDACEVLRFFGQPFG